MKKRFSSFLRLTVALLFVLHFTQAQDAHFTQYYRIPTWYNPALAGENVEHIRLTMLYRNQWSSVGSPFKTQAVFFDKNVSKVGFGINMVNNTAGDAGIRQMYLNGMLSYRLTLGKNQFSSGIMVGLIQKSFDPSKMTFDDQYTPDQGYNAGNATSETFSYTKLTRPDAGVGFNWSYDQNTEHKFHPFAGFAVQHLNQPKESFILDNNIIARKMIMQGGMGITMSEHLTLTPSVVYAKQQTATELMYGVKASFPLEDRNRFETSLNVRQGDAVSAYAGYQFNSWMIGMSYDANTSKLVAHGPGAFELTLTYIPKAKEKKDPVPQKRKDPKEKSGPSGKQAEAASTPSLPDRDGDGISDRIDRCPDVAGTRAMNGCPEKTTVKAEPKAQPVGNGGNVKKTSTPPAPVAAMKQSNPDPVAPAPKTVVTRPEEKVTIMTPKSAAIIPAKVKAKIEKPKATPSPVQVKMQSDETSLPAITRMTMREAKIPVKRISVPNPKVPKVQVMSNHTVVPEKEEEKRPDNMNKLIAREAKITVKHIVTPSPKKAKVTPVSNHTIKPEVITDSDGDGISDDEDTCPFIKGTKATHGCPDTDNDGIADSDDPCPYQTGAKGSNGCPVTKTVANTDEFVKPSQAIGNIEFKTGSDEVKGLYKLDLIEPVLDSLYFNDTYTLVLTGHTDGEGDAAANMVLSQARIDAVKAIFVKKGLDASRISTVAYGETMPLRDNTSEEGRARNRRVEIRIMKQTK